MKNLFYLERLQQVSALSLRNSRTYSDMVTVFKSLRNGMTVDFGLSCSTSNARGCGVKLQHRYLKSRVAVQLFSSKVPSVWNKLPLTIATSPSLTGFEMIVKELFTIISA